MSFWFYEFYFPNSFLRRLVNVGENTIRGQLYPSGDRQCWGIAARQSPSDIFDSYNIVINICLKEMVLWILVLCRYGGDQFLCWAIHLIRKEAIPKPP